MPANRAVQCARLPGRAVGRRGRRAERAAARGPDLAGAVSRPRAPRCSLSSPGRRRRHPAVAFALSAIQAVPHARTIGQLTRAHRSQPAAIHRGVLGGSGADAEAVLPRPPLPAGARDDRAGRGRSTGPTSRWRAATTTRRTSSTTSARSPASTRRPTSASAARSATTFRSRADARVKVFQYAGDRLPQCDTQHVIHDWDDERAIEILKACRRAMRAEATLLLIEGVYPPRIDQIDGEPGRRRE